MPLITEAFDSLPYIDEEPLPEVRAQIATSLSVQVPAEAKKKLHPSLPEVHEPSFSPLIQAELERVASSQKLEAIDTSRYQSADAPGEIDESSDTANKWKDSIKKAYTAHAHLRYRKSNLAALEAHGKNSWLLGNYHLEHELKAIEKELADTKEATETLNRERKMEQEEVRGEISTLDETWRTGVGRAIEVEVANQGLRMQRLEAEKRAAS